MEGREEEEEIEEGGRDEGRSHSVRERETPPRPRGNSLPSPPLHFIVHSALRFKGERREKLDKGERWIIRKVEDGYCRFPEKRDFLRRKEKQGPPFFLKRTLSRYRTTKYVILKIHNHM